MPCAEAGLSVPRQLSAGAIHTSDCPRLMECVPHLNNVIALAVVLSVKSGSDIYRQHVCIDTACVLKYIPYRYTRALTHLGYHPQSVGQHEGAYVCV